MSRHDSDSTFASCCDNFEDPERNDFLDPESNDNWPGSNGNNETKDNHENENENESTDFPAFATIVNDPSPLEHSAFDNPNGSERTDSESENKIQNGIQNGIQNDDVPGFLNDVEYPLTPFFDLSASFGSIAIATANERDKRRKKVLANNLVTLVRRTLGIIKEAPKPARELSEDEENDDHLVQQILERESGWVTLSLPPEFLTLRARTKWIEPDNVLLNWDWEKHGAESNTKGGSSSESTNNNVYSICRLRVLAREGLVVKLLPPSTAKYGGPAGAYPSPNAQNNLQAPEEPFQPSNTQVQRVGAVCEVYNLEWSIEGNTKKLETQIHSQFQTETTEHSDKEESRLLPDDFEDLRTSWKIGSVSLLCRTVEYPPVDEVLLEGKDVFLEGCLLPEIDPGDSSRETNSNSNQPTETKESVVESPFFRLQSQSKLSLAMTSPVNNALAGSDKEKQAVGLALKMCVHYLDEIISVPNLHLSLISARNNGIPTLEQSGDRSMTLGDALRYYLKYYCSGNNRGARGAAAPNAQQTTKFLTVGDSIASFGAMAMMGTSYISPVGAVASIAALAAKDGVVAAAHKGREVRTSVQQSLQAKGQQLFESSDSAREQSAGNESSSNSNSNTREGGYKFGDVTRGLFVSARDGVAAAARKGREVRTSTQESLQGGSARSSESNNSSKNNNNNNNNNMQNEGGYKFGDVTRGVFGSIREKRQQRKLSSLQQQSSSLSSSSEAGNGGDRGNNENENNNGWLARNKGRVAGLGGRTAGALAGFAVLGPLGAVAGSVIGTSAGERAAVRYDQERLQEQQSLEQEQLERK